MNDTAITVNPDSMEPSQYFKILKENIKGIDANMLENHLNLIGAQLIKAKGIGQKSLVDKLSMTYDVIKREQMILAAGYDKFVYQDDVKKFIDLAKVIKVIELERFPRAIPHDNLEDIKDAKELHTIEKKIEKQKKKVLQQDPKNKKKKIEVEIETDVEVEIKHPMFDDFCVVFTDLVNENHTTEEEKAYVNRNRDPIVFGYFKHKNSGLLHDRFYFITDWEDQYCDLTFAKMIDKMVENGIKNPEHTIAADHVYIQELVRSTLKDMNDKTHFTGSGSVVWGGSDEVTVATKMEGIKETNESFFGKLRSWLTSKE